MAAHQPVFVTVRRISGSSNRPTNGKPFVITRSLHHYATSIAVAHHTANRATSHAKHTLTVNERAHATDAVLVA